MILCEALRSEEGAAKVEGPLKELSSVRAKGHWGGQRRAELLTGGRRQEAPHRTAV